MIKKLYKAINIFLITALLFGRGFFVLPAIAEDPTPTSAESSSVASTPTSAPTNEEILAAKMAALDANLAQLQKKLDAIATPAPTNTSVNTTAAPTNTSPSPTGVSGASGSGSAISDASPTASAENNYPSPTGENVNDPANVGTGPLSTNNATETLNQKMETLNKNLAEVQNKVDAINSTGFNYANFNSLEGQVSTGDSLSSLNLLNKLNSNMSGLGNFSVYNVYDTYIGDILFQLAGDNVTGSFDSASGTVSKNAVTGPESTNNAVAENNFKVKEANGNDAAITNDINLSAVTGNNTASFNTGSGNVTSGDATAVGNIINLANTNLNVAKWLFGVVNIWGTMLGNIILPKDTAGTNTTTPVVYTGNTDTGPFSTNNASYTSNTTASFENVNDAVITSSFDTSANTGNNTASVNTGGGYVSTGNSDVAISNSTIANTNTIDEDGTVWMIIVNEAGKWVGHIIGEPWGATSASNSLPVSQTNSGAGSATFTTANDATGAMSENNSSYSQNNESEYINENTAEINNNITANADSGNNETKYNTGAGIIETGDAKVGLNLVNMANTNVTAKKFVAVLVNVMGEFWGNIIPPQQEATPILPSLPPEVNTVTPAPTFPIAQLPSLDEGIGIGGTDILPTIAPIPTIGVTYQEVTETVYIYDNYNSAQTQAPQQYVQAVNQVNNIKKKITYQRTQMAGQIPIQNTPVNQTKIYTRSIFLSPAFAKAVESTFPGMLFGGVSLHVDQSWLSVIPLAFLIFILRRRKKYNLSGTVYRFMDLIL